MTLFFDTHIHLDCLDDLQGEIAAATTAGVGGYVVPGTSPEAWSQLMAVVRAVPQAYAAPGVHPQHADRWEAQRRVELQHYLEDSRTVAVGEVGLDRQVGVSLRIQEEVFREMIHLACTTGKPLLIHQRGATGRLLEILRQERADRVGGIFHAFSGSLDTAYQAIALRFALGIGGVVTYPETRRLPEVVRRVPAEWLVLETDAPDLTPHPYRGQANRPVHLALVAARVGELRGWDSAETARMTTANAERILQLNVTNDFPVTSF